MHYLENEQIPLHTVSDWRLASDSLLPCCIGLYQVPSIMPVLLHIDPRMVGNGFDHAFYPLLVIGMICDSTMHDI